MTYYSFYKLLLAMNVEAVLFSANSGMGDFRTPV